jgi:hypothetical protein
MKIAQLTTVRFKHDEAAGTFPSDALRWRRSSIGIPSPAQDKASVQGLVRDVACPIQNHKSTATDFNLDCALACARSGSPLIILTRTGDIYFPISDQMPDPDQRAKLMPFVGKFVAATGTVYTRNGTRTIVIQNIKELKDVKLKTKDSGD